MIKNLPATLAGVEFLFERYDKLTVAAYRKAVWEVFCRILEQTPQFTGDAVASWTIGIDAPDWQNYAGTGRYDKVNPKQRGDRAMIEFAKSVNKTKLFQIKRNTKVYIANGARGDTDHGKSSPLYMMDLQDEEYWVAKLRAVNKPYETAAETILLHAWKLDPNELREFL